jgi:hypothetical protein
MRKCVGLIVVAAPQVLAPFEAGDAPRQALIGFGELIKSQKRLKHIQSSGCRHVRNCREREGLRTLWLLRLLRLLRLLSRGWADLFGDRSQHTGFS